MIEILILGVKRSPTKIMELKLFLFLFSFFIEIAEQLDTYMDIVLYLTILCIVLRGNSKVLIYKVFFLERIY